MILHMLSLEVAKFWIVQTSDIWTDLNTIEVICKPLMCSKLLSSICIIRVGSYIKTVLLTANDSVLSSAVSKDASKVSDKVPTLEPQSLINFAINFHLRE